MQGLPQSIVVTGASGGIGSAIIKALLERSDIHRIFAVVRDIEHSKKDPLLGDERITLLSMDLNLYADIESLKDTITKQIPTIDWIIFAHGWIDTVIGSVEKETPGNILQTFEVNALSIIYLTRLFLPHLTPGRGVISISSTAGVQATGRHATYSASKAAVNAFTQAMAWSRPEFLFISICPGPTNTKMREAVAHDAAQHQDPMVIAKVVQRIITGENPYRSGDVVVIREGVESIASRIQNA